MSWRTRERLVEIDDAEWTLTRGLDDASVTKGQIVSQVLDRTEPERILRIAETALVVGLSRSQIYRLAADPESGFPRPVKLTEYTSGWRFGELLRWIRERNRA